MQLSAPVASIDGAIIESEIGTYYRLAHAIACKISRRYGKEHLKDDYTQIAVVALMRCLDRYLADKKCSLKVYAQRRMEGAVIDDMRKGIRVRKKCEIYKFEDIDNIEFKHLGYSTDYPLQYDLSHLVFPDSERNTMILIESIMEGNDVTVGKRFNISGSRVCHLKTAFRKANIELLT